MTKKFLYTLGLTAAICSMASALTYTNTVNSEFSDGVLELGAGSGGPVVNGGETGSGTIWVGDWYSSVSYTGLSSVVFPFQLPDAGNVADPFTSAELMIFVEQNQLLPGSAVDLYYVRRAATNELLASDY